MRNRKPRLRLLPRRRSTRRISPTRFRRSGRWTVPPGNGAACWVDLRFGAVSACAYVKMLGSETERDGRRSVFSRRPIATARAIALRVVDLLVFELRGEHCEGGDASAATFRNCLEDRLQDS